MQALDDLTFGTVEVKLIDLSIEAKNLPLDKLVFGAIDMEIPPTRFLDRVSVKLRDIIYEYQEQHVVLLQTFYNRCKEDVPEELRKVILQFSSKDELYGIVLSVNGD